MDNTKIEWCDSTWNPVTGCYHGCEYCYARRIAARFGGNDKLSTFAPFQTRWHRGDTTDRRAFYDEASREKPFLFVIDRPLYLPNKLDKKATKKYGRQIFSNKIAPYPFDFNPTFHRYRLDQPKKWKKPRNIFVCSMADLFGDWVPDEWIKEVFEACEKAPQHRYIFLTKNPARYCDLYRKGILPQGNNYWFGATFDHSNWSKERATERPETFAYDGKTIHDAGDYYFPMYPEKHRFVCFEPILYDIGKNIGNIGAEWIIIGAETGNRKGKVTPQKEWIDNICEAADITHAAVFMKDSLIPIMGEENMRRELPWESFHEIMNRDNAGDAGT